MTDIEWVKGDDGSKGISWNALRAGLRAHKGPLRTANHCEHVTDGCRFCYAERMNRRHGGLAFKPGNRKHYEFVIDEKKLRHPLDRKKPTRWFVESMSDTFGEWWPEKYIDMLYAVMAICPQHTFINLTKRPERRRDYLANAGARQRLSEAAWILSQGRTDHIRWPIPNLIEGISVSDQADADKWVPILLGTPCAVRAVSAEPLLAPIDFTRMPFTTGDPRHKRDALSGAAYLYGTGVDGHPDITVKTTEPRLASLDWIIVGGESHHTAKLARPFDIDWARSIIAQCRQGGCSVFMKQLGSNPYSDGRPMHGNPSGKYTDPSEWPADLRVREHPKMPTVEAAQSSMELV